MANLSKAEDLKSMRLTQEDERKKGGEACWYPAVLVDEFVLDEERGRGDDLFHLGVLHDNDVVVLLRPQHVKVLLKVCLGESLQVSQLRQELSKTLTKCNIRG